jgi:hypothetical protein
MNEQLIKEIKECFEIKGFEITDEKVEDCYNFAINEMKENPFYESPCENCDNPYCKTVDRIWYCSEQR